MQLKLILLVLCQVYVPKPHPLLFLYVPAVLKHLNCAMFPGFCTSLCVMVFALHSGEKTRLVSVCHLTILLSSISVLGFLSLPLDKCTGSPKLLYIIHSENMCESHVIRGVPFPSVTNTLNLHLQFESRTASDFNADKKYLLRLSHHLTE